MQVAGGGGSGTLSGAKAVAAGTGHSLALKTDATVWAWGSDEFGQLGDGGNNTDKSSPVQVMGPGGSGTLGGIKAIAAGGAHSLALVTDGTVLAWGRDDSGELGNGAGSPTSCTGHACATSPVQVAGPGGVGLGGVAAIAAGGAHSLVLKADGTVWSWGDDRGGQVGDGAGSPANCGNGYPCALSPVQVVGPGGSGTLGGVAAIAAGGAHSLVLKADGTVWAWGYDGSGQLGDGTVANPDTSATPSQVVASGGGFLTDVVAIAGGDYHSLALKSDGTVWAWGDDEYGQLGDGSVAGPPFSATPSQVISLSNVTAIDGGAFHSLALQADGTVWAWGYDASGQLGDGTEQSPLSRGTPMQVVAPGGGFLTGISAITAGSRHSLALKADGTVWVWGSDGSGEAGDGTVQDPPFNATPSQVVAPGGGFLTGVTALAAGSSYSLALKADGTVWAWGEDGLGHLGDGTVGDGAGGHGERAIPNQVVAPGGGFLTNVIAVAAGFTHSLALRPLPVPLLTVNPVTAPYGGNVTLIAILTDHGTGVGGQTVTFSLRGTIVGTATTNASGVALLDVSLGTIPVGDYPGGVGASFAGNAVYGASSGTAGLTITSPPGAVLTTGPTGSGGGTVSPPGGTVQGGAVVSLSAVPATGSLFTGWTVDGANAGWANPLTVTMDQNHTVQATFVTAKTFAADVPSSHPNAAAITELATRGTILGYNATSYGPDDGVQRAQMAVLIARATPNGPGTPTNGTLTPPGCTVAGTWDCEDWGTTFTDRSGVPASLWRAAGTLQHYSVAFGYSAQDCASKGRAFPCYGPTDPVSYAQTIAFITQAMVAKGYWELQLNAPLPGGNVPGVLAKEMRTFAFYTGGIPDAPSDWNAGASRGWFAETLWAALDSYWGQDRVP